MTTSRIGTVAAPLLSSALAIGAALLMGAALLVVTGHEPWPVYRTVFGRGLGSEFGITESLVKATPLMIVAAGLLIAVKTGVWNIGIDGQSLVGALAVGFVAPTIAGDIPDPLLWLGCGLLGMIVGSLWASPPALLRARYGLNEIITTIMFNYVAISLTAYLVKGPLRDKDVVAPQTRPVPVEHRLPDIPGTDIHSGLLVALVAVLVVAFVLTRTTLGFKAVILGQSRRVALHAGYPIQRYTAAALMISGALAGLAGTSDVLATKGLFQANWYPEYGLAAFALVFLARLQPLMLLPVGLLFGVLALGADLLRSDDVPNYFIPLLEGLILVSLAATVRLERLKGMARIGSFWTSRSMAAERGS
jgi:ABC-type uncharacterized transport system permease subunit